MHDPPLAPPAGRRRPMADPVGEHPLGLVEVSADAFAAEITRSSLAPTALGVLTPVAFLSWDRITGGASRLPR